MLKVLHEEASKLNYYPRKVQEKAIEWIESVWESNNICKVLSCPVGSGKSLIAKTIASYLAKEKMFTAIVTPQNILIDQYISEFADLNYFKGKSHYSCKKTKSTCEVGIELEKISKSPCTKCPYRIAKAKCYNNYTTIFNPMSYFNLSKVINDSGKLEVIYNVNTIIVDEFQSLPSMLRELITIKIWEHDINWISGVSSSIPLVCELLEKYNELLEFYIISPYVLKKEKLKIMLTQRRVDTILSQLKKHSSYFICEESIEKYRNVNTKCLIIRPKYVPPSIYKNFFKIAKKIVFMSGTAFPFIWEELGFSKPDYIDLPSPISKVRRPVYATSTIDISEKHKENENRILSDLSEQIKYIVDYIHPEENGIILLPYSLGTKIKPFLKEKHFIHMEKRTKSDKILEFKESKERVVGIFSGSYEGLSLGGDLSRFTIIPKVPFPNLKDKVVSVRLKENNINYSMETITLIIQATGRSCRSETDYSATYILDKNFGFLYCRTKEFLPKYFKDSVLFRTPNENDVILFESFKKGK